MTHEDRWAEFEQLVRSIGVGMLTSHAEDGSLHARPLQTLRVSKDSLWFFTDRESAKTAEVARDPRVSVAYADLATHRFAAVGGVGSWSHDPALARDLWHADQRAYYPAGPADERIAVLAVSIERAEYWLAPGRAAYYVAALKAFVTGDPVARIGEDYKL